MLGHGVEEALGPVQHLWNAEVCPDASAILARHRSVVPNLGDITGGAPAGCPDDVMRAHARRKWTQAPRADIIDAGWPCPAYSLGGRRRGSGDERHLWPAVAGCLDVQRPAVFIGENVPGLLNVEDGAVFATVLNDLTDLGYTVQWQTRGSCRVGGCHHRHRVFIHATLDGHPAPTRHPLAWRLDGAGIWVDCDADLFGDPVPFNTWPSAGIAAGGQVRSLPADVCGADGLTLFPTPCARDGDGRGEGSAGYWETRRLAGRTKGMPLGAAVGLLSEQGWGRFAAAVDRWEAASGRIAPAPVTFGPKGGRELAAPFVEWMLGVDPGYVTAHVDNDTALRILGNGVMWRAATHALRDMATIGVAA